MFSISGVLWTEFEPKYIKRLIEMPLWFLLKFPTITIVSSCSCYWQKSFFSSKSINNVVKSSFQSFLDLGGRGGAVCEVEWIREVKSLKSSSSSRRGNLALERWWERWWNKCDWKKTILRNTVCVYSLQWENGYGGCAPQEPSRWALRWMNDETCEKLEQCAKRSSVPQFLGKVEGGATVADIYLAKQKVRIFCLPWFVRDHWQIWFSLGSLPCFFLHVLNAIW
jgi:hypothetical protein